MEVTRRNSDYKSALGKTKTDRNMHTFLHKCRAFGVIFDFSRLPEDLRAAVKVHVFKKRLRAHLFSLAFN